MNKTITLHLGLIMFIAMSNAYKNGKECLIASTDKCFTKFLSDISCLSETAKGDEQFTCNGATAQEICRTLEDSLNCTSDLTDSSCDVSTLTNYATWMKGFRAAHRKLCSDDLSQIQELFDNPTCWNLGKFLTCIEENANVVHMTDLANTPLDITECNNVIVSIAMCNFKAEKNRIRCRGKATILSDGLVSFLSESSCWNTIRNELISDTCSHQANVQSTVAVTMTLLVVGVTLVGVVIFIMMNKVVTVNKRFRLYNDEDDDKDVLNPTYSASQN